MDANLSFESAFSNLTTLKMKTLIIINEPFEKMVLGKNNTLSYILAAFELGHEVYIHNLPKTGEAFPKNINYLIPTLKLDTELGISLTETFKEINQKIVNYVHNQDYIGLRALPLTMIPEFIKNIQLQNLNLKDVDLVLQRLEPMKAPFPPEGSKSVDLALKEIRQVFPSNIIFNCPIELSDKEIPQEINRILQRQNEELIATATIEFKLSDTDFSEAFITMRQEYQKLFGNLAEKLVLKPKNSAQTLGVFALEVTSTGFDLPLIKSQKIIDLAETQFYKIKDNIDKNSLKEIVEILCFVQRVRNNKIIFDNLKHKIISEVSRDEIVKNALELYNEEILVQPFIEGVKLGDVRTNYLKDENGYFYIAGTTFRSSLREKNDKSFTTSYITGGAISKPLLALSLEEQKDLLKKSKRILEILNKDLRDQYKNSTELGADFILVGDAKTVLLGEINHHCPGLLPISEAMEKATNQAAFYDGGLALTKRAITDLIKLQKI